MKYKFVVQVVAVVVVVVFAAGILLSGGTVEVAWLRFMSVAVLAATLILVLWEGFVWKLRPVQKLQVVPPSVAGTWKGTLKSQWIDPSTKSAPKEKPVFLVVRQRASSIRVSVITDESSSTSTMAVLSKGADDVWVIDHVYLNEPGLSVRDRSPMHHGSGSLRVAGRPAERIQGKYWTDRDSKGELQFDQHVRTLAQDFEGCERLFATRPKP